MMSILLVLKWIHWAVSDRPESRPSSVRIKSHTFSFFWCFLLLSSIQILTTKNKEKQLKKHACWTIKNKFSGCRVLRSGTFEVNKSPVGRSSDGCFSTKLTWSLLQVHCWQKHFLNLYVTDSQILQLSDNFQVLWPSVAPGSLLFSYFIWVVGIKLISEKIEISGKISGFSLHCECESCFGCMQAKSTSPTGLFFAVVDQKAFMAVFIH